MGSYSKWKSNEMKLLKNQQYLGKAKVTKIFYGQMQSLFFTCLTPSSPQWGAADAEIEVPSGENTELKRFPFNAWSRSVYSLTCYAYCWEFFLAYFYPSGPFTCIFSKTSPNFFPVLAVANTGSCVGPQNKIGHPVGCRFPCWVPAEYKQAKNMTCGMMTCERNNLEIEVCVQPWCNPLWLTGLKAPTNQQTNPVRWTGRYNSITN